MPIDAAPAPLVEPFTELPALLDDRPHLPALHRRRRPGSSPGKGPPAASSEPRSHRSRSVTRCRSVTMRATMVKKATIVGVGLAMVAVSLPCAAVDPEQVYQAAVADMKAGRYADACPRFAEARKLAPESTPALHGLATCLDKFGKWASAWTKYRELAVELKAHGDERAPAAMERAAELAKILSTVTVRVQAPEPPGLILRLDREELPHVMFDPAIKIDPGADHVLEATAPGFEVWQTKLRDRGAQRRARDPDPRAQREGSPAATSGRRALLGATADPEPRSAGWGSWGWGLAPPSARWRSGRTPTPRRTARPLTPACARARRGWTSRTTPSRSPTGRPLRWWWAGWRWPEAWCSWRRRRPQRHQQRRHGCKRRQCWGRGRVGLPWWACGDHRAGTLARGVDGR